MRSHHGAFLARSRRCARCRNWLAPAASLTSSSRNNPELRPCLASTQFDFNQALNLFSSRPDRCHFRPAVTFNHASNLRFHCYCRICLSIREPFDPFQGCFYIIGQNVDMTHFPLRFRLPFCHTNGLLNSSPSAWNRPFSIPCRTKVTCCPRILTMTTGDKSLYAERQMAHSAHMLLELGRCSKRPSCNDRNCAAAAQVH